MSGDMTKAFNKRPYDEFADEPGELEAHHMNDTYQAACNAALERARAEIEHERSLSDGQFADGLNRAATILTRLLETRP